MRFRKIILSGILLLTLSGLLFLWTLLPTYYDLNIPVKTPKKDGIFWDETSYSEFSPTDREATYYMVRRKGTAYLDLQDWKTREEAIAYFDKWLVADGWQRQNLFTDGDSASPESTFLEYGTSYFEYIRNEDRGDGVRGRVVLTVWSGSDKKYDDECCGKRFEISVVTIKPSFWTERFDALAD
jgi:hypothetical protein